MHGFEDGAVVTDVCARHQGPPKPPINPAQRSENNVTVEILAQQNVETVSGRITNCIEALSTIMSELNLGMSITDFVKSTSETVRQRAS